MRPHDIGLGHSRRTRSANRSRRPASMP